MRHINDKLFIKQIKRQKDKRTKGQKKGEIL